MALQDRDVLAIVGAGQAGAELAFSLRRQGCAASILLVGEELHAPYQRPPLSKAYLQGAGSTASLHVREREAYDRAGIQLLLGARVARIERKAKMLQLEDGREFGYTRVALATGAAARRLNIPGAQQAEQAGRLHYLRTLADVQRIREQLSCGKRLIIIGGGFLGLEIAASLAARNVKVTILEAAPRVLVRVTGPHISTFYEDVHRAAGVDVRTGVAVKAFDRDASGLTYVHCADGPACPADLVIVAVGVVPNTYLAQTAGLHVDDGVVVDERTRTSDPDVVAVGDCASYPNPFVGRHARLESVPAALEQARMSAATLMQRPPPACAVPWFWSEQYDLKLQMCGSAQDATSVVVRGDPHTRSFTVFHFREGRVVASESVDRPQEFMLARRWIASRAIAEPDVLSDDTVPLSEVQQATISRRR